MYKQITSAKCNDDFSIGFDRDRNETQQELTKNNNIKGKCHVRIMLKDIFGSSEHQKYYLRLGIKISINKK